MEVDMSSFVAHSLVGFTLGKQRETATLKETIFISFFFIFLACSPDIDYLIIYLRGESMPIRYTHSIGYIFLIFIFALLFRNFIFRKSLYPIPIYLFFLAPASHLLLDFLVGVYANPYFYPFSSSTFIFPFGILPSAGRINIFNYYFWRNIFIELAIFIPLISFLVPNFRKYIMRYKLVVFLLISIFLIGVFVGFNLKR
jgi:membrane-bound metal-dependent hydrolase YbcI (DUF457 family)